MSARARSCPQSKLQENLLLPDVRNNEWHAGEEDVMLHAMKSVNSSTALLFVLGMVSMRLSDRTVTVCARLGKEYAKSLGQSRTSDAAEQEC